MGSALWCLRGSFSFQVGHLSGVLPSLRVTPRGFAAAMALRSVRWRPPVLGAALPRAATLARTSGTPWRPPPASIAASSRSSDVPLGRILGGGSGSTAGSTGSTLLDSSVQAARRPKPRKGLSVEKPEGVRAAAKKRRAAARQSKVPPSQRRGYLRVDKRLTKKTRMVYSDAVQHFKEWLRKKPGLSCETVEKGDQA